MIRSGTTRRRGGVWLVAVLVAVLVAGLVGPVRASSDPTSGACTPGGSPPVGPPAEIIAVRALQTRLMVSALSCGARTEYAAFVRRFRHVLTGNACALQTLFVGGTPGAGTARDQTAKAMDSLVTRLANDAAAESNADRDGFCACSAETLARLNGPAPSGLATLLKAMALETASGVACGGGRADRYGC